MSEALSGRGGVWEEVDAVEVEADREAEAGVSGCTRFADG